MTTLLPDKALEIVRKRLEGAEGWPSEVYENRGRLAVWQAALQSPDGRVIANLLHSDPEELAVMITHKGRLVEFQQTGTVEFLARHDDDATRRQMISAAKGGVVESLMPYDENGQREYRLGGLVDMFDVSALTNEGVALDTSPGISGFRFRITLLMTAETLLGEDLDQRITAVIEPILMSGDMMVMRGNMIAADIDPILSGGEIEALIETQLAAGVEAVLGVGDADLLIMADTSGVISELLGTGDADVFVGVAGSGTIGAILGSGVLEQVGPGIGGAVLLDPLLGSGDADALLGSSLSGVIDAVVGSGAASFGSGGSLSGQIDSILSAAEVGIIVEGQSSGVISSLLGTGSATALIAGAGAGVVGSILGSGDGAIFPAPGINYDYYVDSVNGDDANPGTEAAPFQTLAQASAAMSSAGTSLGLFRGSTWYEEFRPPRDNFTIGIVGTGAPPIFDGALLLDGTWTPHADTVNYPDVWQQTGVFAPSAANEITSLWVDDVLPTLQASIADVQANGGWYTPDVGAANPVFSIKSTVDPNTSGVEYRHSAVRAGINAHGQVNGNSLTIDGPVEMRRYYGTYGNFEGGQFDLGGSENRLLLRDGAIHHMVSESAVSEDIISLGVIPYGTASGAMTWYRADGAGFDPVIKRCGYWTGYNDHTESLDRRGGIQIHDSTVGGIQCTLDAEQTWCRAGGRSMSGASNGITCRGHYTWNSSTAWAVPTNSVVRYGIARLNPDNLSSAFEDTGPAISADRNVVFEDCIFFVEPGPSSGSMVSIAERNGSYTFRRCLFFVCDLDSNNSAMLSANADTGIDLVVENCMFVATGPSGTGLRSMIVLTEAASTYTGTNNLFVGSRTLDDDTYIDLNLRGANYRTLADAQAAGYDTNSVHIGAGWTLTDVINNLFEGNPLEGDFRLKSDLSAYGAFGDSAALTTAGPQTHWDWATRATASGAPKQWPVPPWSVEECRDYLDDPDSWNFYEDVPGAVTDLAVTVNVAGEALDLTWTPPTSADGASQGVPVIKVSTDNVTFTDATDVTFTDIGLTSGAATVGSLTSGTLTYVKLVYENEQGPGADSNTVSETPSANLEDQAAAIAATYPSATTTWLEPSSASIATDGTGGQPVNTESIGRFLDKTGNGNHFFAASGITTPSDVARPVFTEDGQYVYAAINGSSNWMAGVNDIVLGDQWWHVGLWSSITQARRFFTTDNDWKGAIEHLSGNEYCARDTSNAQVALSSGGDVRDPFVMTVEKTDATTMSGRFNGGNSAGVITNPNVNYGDTQLALFVARNTTGTGWFNGRFYGGMWGTGALSTSDRATLEQYFSTLGPDIILA